MALLSSFQLPDELLISSLAIDFPCREPQIRSLLSLLSPRCKIPKNLVIYGLEATGKSSIIATALLKLYSSDISAIEPDRVGDGKERILQHTVVKSAECITGRHLLETIVGAIAYAVGWKGTVHRCENLAQLAVEIDRLLDGSNQKLHSERGDNGVKSSFILVLDGIDKQRDAPPTLLQALARMGEVIPSLTIIFIVTSPRPHFLHVSGVPHIHFPAYTKPEVLKIISHCSPGINSRLTPPSEAEDEPQKEQMRDIWTRFCSAVWDTLSKHSGRDIVSFRATCSRLWPSFIAPLEDGLFTTKDFGRLLVSRRSLFQEERVLVPSISPNPSRTSQLIADPKIKTSHLAGGITTQLPLFSRLLLIAAYLSSYTPARNDSLLFLKASLKARRKKGGGTAKGRHRASKHRKISTKLLGPQAFVLERMLAIFHAVRVDAGLTGAAQGSADIPMAVATLASLRLVIRTSAAADPLDASTKWKVNVGWEVVRGIARSVGVEVEDFVIE